MSVILGAALAAALTSAQDITPQRVAPRGSYAQSCEQAYTNRGRLYADCRDMRGRMRGTSIELSRCGNDEIHNDDGLLTCGRTRGDYEEGRPDYPGRPEQRPERPGGGWGRTSITVYQDADYRGRPMRFDAEAANLGRSGMNDAISSMRVQGRWEVCADAYFRGACQVVDGDVRNLGSTGFNDRISSLRPVRGGRW